MKERDQSAHISLASLTLLALAHTYYMAFVTSHDGVHMYLRGST